MATLVRIEKNGLGLFRYRDRGYSRNKIVRRIWERHRTFPTPYQEELPMSSSMFCAYNSLELMESWISRDELKFLIDRGFQVLVINASMVFEGEFQSIYDKKDIVSTYNISDLFTN